MASRGALQRVIGHERGRRESKVRHRTRQTSLREPLLDGASFVGVSVERDDGVGHARLRDGTVKRARRRRPPPRTRPNGPSPRPRRRRRRRTVGRGDARAPRASPSGPAWGARPRASTSPEPRTRAPRASRRRRTEERNRSEERRRSSEERRRSSEERRRIVRLAIVTAPTSSSTRLAIVLDGVGEGKHLGRQRVSRLPGTNLHRHARHSLAGRGPRARHRARVHEFGRGPVTRVPRDVASARRA